MRRAILSRTFGAILAAVVCAASAFAADGGAEGRVVNARTGQPVPEAAVTFTMQNSLSGQRPVTIRSGADGGFKFAGPAGAYSVQAYKETYLRAFLTAQVPDGAVAAMGDLQLSPLPTVRIQARDETGAPIPNAVVYRWGQPVATAGPDGAVELVWLARERLVIFIRAPSGDRAAFVDEPCPDSGALTVALRKCGALTGLVRKADGAPIAGASVSAIPQKPDLRVGASDKVATDAQGRYTVAGLVPDQEYTIGVEAAGFLTDGALRARIVIARSGVTTETEPVVMLNLKGPLSGRVTDASGLPVSGAVVSLTGTRNKLRQADPDAEGAFRFDDVFREPVTVTTSVRDQAYEPDSRQVTPSGFEDVRIMLWPKEVRGGSLSVGAAAPPLDGVEIVQSGPGFPAIVQDLGFLKGKRVMLAFVSIRNPASRKAIRDLQAAADASRDKATAWLLVHDSSAESDDVRAYLDANHITLPTLCVAGRRHVALVSRAFIAYRVASLPTVVVIDPQGRVESTCAAIERLPALLGAPTVQ